MECLLPLLFRLRENIKIYAESDRQKTQDHDSQRCRYIHRAFANDKGNEKGSCPRSETFDNNGRYDAIIIYNAFPHFPDGDKLISHLSTLLNKDGTLTIAHGMSRDKINSHHINVSTDLKCELPEGEKLASLFAPYLEVTDIISDERMYLVSGRKQ